MRMVGQAVAARALPIAPDPMRWCLAAILAVTAYLAALGGLGLVALVDARRDWDRAIGDVLTLQLPADTSAARLEVVLALVRQTAGISGAQALHPSETARLLEPWLGKSVPVDILPLPRLVDIRMDPAAAVDLDGLQQRLESVAPEARLEDHRLWLAKLRSASSHLQAILVAVMIGAAVVTVVGAVVTASGTVVRNGERIALLHALGADDLDIARRLAIPAGGIALLGGTLGAFAAAGTWYLVSAAAASLGLAFATPALLDGRAVLLLAIIALASGVIAVTAAAVIAWRAIAWLP